MTLSKKGMMAPRQGVAQARSILGWWFRSRWLPKECCRPSCCPGRRVGRCSTLFLSGTSYGWHHILCRIAPATTTTADWKGPICSGLQRGTEEGRHRWSEWSLPAEPSHTQRVAARGCGRGPLQSSLTTTTTTLVAVVVSFALLSSFDRVRRAGATVRDSNAPSPTVRVRVEMME